MNALTRIALVLMTFLLFITLPVLGQSDGPPEESEPGAPDCPTDLAGYGPQTGGIFMSWTLRSKTDVNVYRDDGDGDFVLLDRLDFPATRYIDHLAEPGETYHYQVTAIADNGTESRACETATLTAVPHCPADLSAHAHGNGDVSLSWTLQGETDVKVYRAVGDGEFVFLERLEHPATDYLDTDTEPGETYRYRVNTITDDDTEKELCEVVEVTAVPFFPSWVAALGAGAIVVGGYAMMRRRQ